MVKRRGVTLGGPTINLYRDEIQNLADYEFYKKPSEHYGKPIALIPRPETKPANALVVRRS